MRALKAGHALTPASSAFLFIGVSGILISPEMNEPVRSRRYHRLVEHERVEPLLTDVENEVHQEAIHASHTRHL